MHDPNHEVFIIMKTKAATRHAHHFDIAARIAEHDEIGVREAAAAPLRYGIVVCRGGQRLDQNALFGEMGLIDGFLFDCFSLLLYHLLTDK